jgi:uncharacterized protein YfaS (alpha-2-macroglobulin family)
MRQWLKLFSIWVLISLACSLPGSSTATPSTAPTNLPTPTLTAEISQEKTLPTAQEPVPPALVEVDPQPNSPVNPQEGFTFYFSADMNRASVESALVTEPVLSGSFDWLNNQTVRFLPENELPPESSITLIMSTAAQDQSGKPLVRMTDMHYTTPGYLQLTGQLPEPGSVEISTGSAIVATFNQPIIPLSGEEGDYPAAFRIEPAVSGRGEWVNTSTYIFYPEPGLEGGTQYTISLDPDLSSLMGMPLSPDETQISSWSFTTATPELISVSPDNAQMLMLDDPITLSFNVSMDADQFEDHFSLLNPSGFAVHGSYNWNEDFTQVEFVPDVLLDRDSTYFLTLSADTPALGGSPLGTDFRASYLTVGDLAVVNREPPVNQPLDIYNFNYTSLAVVFNAPLAQQPLEDRVRIEPAVGELSLALDPNQKTLYISGYFEPETTYTLTLLPELQDRWDRAIEQPVTLTFQTSSVWPSLIVPMLSFSQSMLFARPEDSAMTAQAVNLNTIEISRAPLSLQEFVLSAGDPYNIDSIDADALETWVTRPDLPPNQNEDIRVPLSPDDTDLAPGLYYYRLNSPELIGQTPGESSQVFLLAVGNIQITLKHSQDQVFLWLVDLRTQQPVADAEVTLYNRLLQEIGSVTTTADGIAQLDDVQVDDMYENIFAVTGEPGSEDFGLANSNWGSGISGWNFGMMTNVDPVETFSYLYTDRPIYQPGQTVFFRGVLRSQDNARYSQPPTEDVTYQIWGDYYNSPGGRPLLVENRVSLSQYGTFSGELKLPEDAQPGNYTLTLKDMPGSDLYFQVAEYRKPEIELNVSFRGADITAGNDLRAAVQARYYFGQPAADRELTWSLYALPEPISLSGGYQTGPIDLNWNSLPSWFFGAEYVGNYVTGGEGVTDADGRLNLRIPGDTLTNLLNSQARQRLTLEVSLSDESERPVSARSSQIYQAGDAYIGVRPDSWSAQAGSEIGFSVQVVDKNSQPSGTRSLQARFQKVTWEQGEVVNAFGGYPTVTPVFTPAGSVDFETGSDGRARVAFTPEEPGTHMLEIEGESALTQVLVWAGGTGAAVWPSLPDQHLTLTADAEAYEPGQEASVFIPNPFENGALALVTIERGRVMRSQVLEVEDSNLELNLPILEDDAPNIYVSVTLVGTLPDGRPDFRMGYLELPVDPAAQTLQVELVAQPQQAEPGDEMQFGLRIRDQQGNPVQGEFSLAVVDKAVLALADPNAPDIVDAFYGVKPLGVKNSLSLAAYIQRTGLTPAGGGGGGGAAPPELRQQFEDTAYWNGTIETDEDGLATVQLRLPDNLTTWVVTARGLTQDNLVGETELEVVASQDLLIRPVTPRFLVAGDHVELAAVLHNNTGEPIAGEVSLTAQGFSLDEPDQAAQAVSLMPNSQQRVTWWGTAEQVDAVDLVFSADAGGLQDSTTPEGGSIPVLSYTSTQTFGASGALSEAGERTEVVALPRTFEAQAGELRTELNPSLAAAILSGLEAQENFEYDFTEAVLSRFLPNLYAYRALEEMGLDAGELAQQLDQNIPSGIDHLLRMQNSDGGWGFTLGSQSNVTITSYVLLGLSLANQAGYSVNAEAINLAVSYLSGALPLPDAGSTSADLDRIAFGYYALHRAGYGETNPDLLYEFRTELNPWASAMLALQLADRDPQDERVRVILSDLLSQANRSATSTHWEDRADSTANMSSPNLNTAVVVLALSRLDPAAPELDEAVRYLLSNRSAYGGWASTYDTAWVILALTEAMRGTGSISAGYEYAVSLNGEILLSGEASGTAQTEAAGVTVPVTELSRDAVDLLTVQRGEGPGRLYYQAYLEVQRPVEDLQAVSRGLTLTRRYYTANEDCRESGCTEITSTSLSASNSLVLVRLSLTVPEDTYYLVVEDTIPAGMEIVDLSLNTTQQAAGEINNVTNPFETGWQSWIFGQPRVYSDHAQWAAEYVPAGTYELVYRLQPLQIGEFRTIPAHAYQYYFPEIEGSSAGGVFEIKP